VSTRAYTALGWVVWQVGKRVVRRKLAHNRAKAAAAGAIGLVVLGGIGLARAGGDAE
jgi:hypothetical protein